METCTRCGADTELYYNNVPICLLCSDDLGREIQKRDFQIPQTQLARDGTYPEDLKAIESAPRIGVGQIQGGPEYLKRTG
jgi:hypothetical protein